MFIHFLLTRFNLKISSWEKTRDNKSIDERWLEHRFELFDLYCFPSVKNQTNQNFKWIVFFDINTSDKHRHKVYEYEKSFKNFIPVFTTGDSFSLSMMEAINKFVKTNTTHIITTRLDNDDAVHIDFINKIQSCFKYQDFCLIDIINGYIYQIEPKKEFGAIAVIEKKSNPFISLIEPVDSYQTILTKKHGEWASEKNKIIIKDRLWLQIIHDYNMINAMKSRVIYVSNNVLKNFSITNIETNIILSIINNLYIIINNINNNIYYLIKVIKTLGIIGIYKRIISKVKKRIRKI